MSAILAISLASSTVIDTLPFNLALMLLVDKCIAFAKEVCVIFFSAKTPLNLFKFILSLLSLHLCYAYRIHHYSTFVKHKCNVFYFFLVLLLHLWYYSSKGVIT
nr:MAG TPA_asm: hypothetical protein [Caudoviricetes sp.]